MVISQTESAIGLYAYHQEVPDASLYARFYALVREQLAAIKVEPTYFGVVGEEYSRGLTKFGGRRHKDVLNANFENITAISLAANPPGSDAPAYDSYFNGSIGFTKTSGFPQSVGGVVELLFVVNESFLPFGSEVFQRVLKELIELYAWDIGMGFSDEVERRSVFHITCFGHDKLALDERVALQAWYSTPPEVRVVKLRSIYPYNVMNEQQLAQEVQPGFSLREFIAQESIGTLERLPGGRLWLWKVPDPIQRGALRRQLHWKAPGVRQLQAGQIDWNQPGIVIDSVTLIP